MYQMSCNYLMHSVRLHRICILYCAQHTVTIKIQISHPKTIHSERDLKKKFFLLIHKGIFDRTNCTQTNSLLQTLHTRTIATIISRGCCLLDV